VLALAFSWTVFWSAFFGALAAVVLVSIISRAR